MAISFNKLCDLQQTVFRNIPRITPEFDEFADLTANPDIRQYAHKKSAYNKKEITSSKLQYHSIDFIFQKNVWNPSRFGDGSYPVWYGSLDTKTSIMETLYHWKNAFILAPQGFSSINKVIKTSRTIVQVHCVAALIDLRKQTKNYKALIHTDPTHYSFTQKIGNRIYEEGHPGLLSKSARNKSGDNLAVFNKNVLSNPKHYNDYLYEYHGDDNKTSVFDANSNALLLRIKELWHRAKT